MAVIRDFSNSTYAESVERIDSASAGKTDSIELEGFRLPEARVLVGVQMFDAEGVQIVDTGNFTVHLKTPNTNWWELPPPDNQVISAATPTTLSWGANTVGIRVVPSGLTDTVTWKVVITANLT